MQIAFAEAKCSETNQLGPFRFNALAADRPYTKQLAIATPEGYCSGGKWFYRQLHGASFVQKLSHLDN